LFKGVDVQELNPIQLGQLLLAYQKSQSWIFPID
jgi:hypothetical protein